MTDLSLLERDIRRVLNSKRSIAYRTASAEKLLQGINGLYTAIPDDQTRGQFRAEYRALVERIFGQSPPDGTGTKARVAELFLEQARNLKEAEATKEKLNRELGGLLANLPTPPPTSTATKSRRAREKSRSRTSLVAKRSVVIRRHKTSVSVEKPFWDGLKEIAVLNGIGLQDLVTKIDQGREHSNLSSAIRLFVLDYYYRAKDRTITG